MGVDRRDHALEHRPRAHPPGLDPAAQPLDQVVGRLGHALDALHVVAIVRGGAEGKHLRRARHHALDAAERAQRQRFGVAIALSLDGAAQLVLEQLVGNMLRAMQLRGVDRAQALERAPLALVLALEARLRVVGQEVVVAGDPSRGRLEWIEVQARIEVLVEQALELPEGRSGRLRAKRQERWPGRRGVRRGVGSRAWRWRISVSRLAMRSGEREHQGEGCAIQLRSPDAAPRHDGRHWR
jgi:hypothetical protein